MNDLTATVQDTALSTLDQELAEEAKKMATALGGANTIKAASGMFTFPDDRKVPGPLNMVVLAARIHKQLWNKPYDPRDRAGQRGLICAAVGDASLDRNNLVPFDTALDKKNDVCNGCPQNHWEKRPGGKNVKIGDCKDGMSFAVMMPNPDTQGGDIYIIRGSATGLTEAIKTMKELKSRYGHPVRGIVEFSFVPSPGGSLRLATKVVGPNHAYAQHASYRHEGDAALTREPRWMEEDDGEAPEAPVQHEAPASAGRARSRASAGARTAAAAAAAYDVDDDIAF